MTTQPLEPLQVLICDDNVGWTAFLTEILAAEEDLEVTGIASSVREARALVAERAPDLIVLDLYMRGESGGAYLAELAQKAPELPVVVLSGAPLQVLTSVQGSTAHAVLGKDAVLDGRLVASLRAAQATGRESRRPTGSSTRTARSESIVSPTV